LTLHDKLVARAVRWCMSRDGGQCVVAVSEMTTQELETPDVLGWRSAKHTVLVECKSNRADFLTDRHKLFRRQPELGMGNQRYYLCWPRVVEVEDLPDGWGLLWQERAVRVLRFAEYRSASREAEAGVLLSTVRRKPGECGKTISARWYQFGTKNRARVIALEAETTKRRIDGIPNTD
jgi:hypothetical protein